MLNMLMPARYCVVSICDISQETIDHVAVKFDIPHKTTQPSETISLPNVDLVMILAADEFHESLCISALKAGKLVFIEKPITLSIPSVERILTAEKAAGGNKIFVGYMRRYAPSFTQAFLREAATIPRIMYARVRDIIGPNAHFVRQSGTSPAKFTDFPAGAAVERKVNLDKLLREAFQVPQDQYPSKRDIDYCRFLGSLGSHDLSLMREALGFPESVTGVSANEPFYSAIFNYRNKTGEPFSVTYESGIDNVPRFDASLAIYGENKTVSIKYDTPYVKGLPIKVTVDELNEFGEVSSKEILSSYEDAYTVELREAHECFTSGKMIKTTAIDSSNELRLYDMMYRQLAKQS
jgi:predicted dehydrogenase